MATLKTTDTCPCGGYVNANSYAECCAPFIEDGAPAPTPEQLMRSRYSAFATQNADHLWRTWHPKTRPAEIGELDGVTWTGLEILAANGAAQDDEGTVDFAAHFTPVGGAPGVLREHSRFSKRAGRWFYVNGDEI